MLPRVSGVLIGRRVWLDDVAFPLLLDEAVLHMIFIVTEGPAPIKDDIRTAKLQLVVGQMRANFSTN